MTGDDITSSWNEVYGSDFAAAENPNFLANIRNIILQYKCLSSMHIQNSYYVFYLQNFKFISHIDHTLELHVTGIQEN